MLSKTLTKALLLSLVIPLLFLVPACGDDDDNPTNPTASVHDDLVTTWRAASVTMDGETVSLADFFEFSTNGLAYNLIINADTTYRGEELDSVTDPANVLYYEEGTAVSSGNTLTITVASENGVDLDTPEVVASGTWEVNGTTLTFIMEDSGHTIVLTWTNWMA